MTCLFYKGGKGGLKGWAISQERSVSDTDHSPLMPVHVRWPYLQDLLPCTYLLDAHLLFKTSLRMSFLYSSPRLLQAPVGSSVQHSFLKLREMQWCSKIVLNPFWSCTGIKFLFWWSWQWLLVIGPLPGLCLSMVLAHCPRYFHLQTCFWKKGLRIGQDATGCWWCKS